MPRQGRKIPNTSISFDGETSGVAQPLALFGALGDECCWPSQRSRSEGATKMVSLTTVIDAMRKRKDHKLENPETFKSQTQNPKTQKPSKT